MSSIDQKLLEILHENKNKYVSGEDISNMLGVSRTAIWKHIKKYRDLGYEIESVTNRGYTIIKVPDRIIAEEIMIGLENKEIGNEIIVFDSIDSTNNKAKELARDKCKSGTVIVAEEQVAGRGRLGRKWHSPVGSGLWFSIVVRPDILPIKSPFLTISASLAVLDAVRCIVNEVCGKINNKNIKNKIKIKWPNDILFEEKKIAGILSEMSADMEQIKYGIIGIGINVNQDFFSEDIKDTATSLKKICYKKIDRIKLLKYVLNYFEGYYEKLIKGKENELLEKWKSNLNVIGEEVIIYSNKKTFYGKVIDISTQGELILQDKKNILHKFWAGDVSLRKT
ncbi:MAG: biotin--[acetyl-CoA-carboxylase] ligase [Halanaerobiaceae bacterium]